MKTVQFMTVLLDDFNAKTKRWYKNDIIEGSIIDAGNYILCQVIQEPTHILNSSPSSIDLIFTSQLNLGM